MSMGSEEVTRLEERGRNGTEQSVALSKKEYGGRQRVSHTGGKKLRRKLIK